MNLYIKIITLLFFNSFVYGQMCDKPFAISFADRSQDSIKVKWLSTSGQNINGHQIAYGVRGTSVDNALKSDTFSQKNFIIKNLKPSTQYILFVRTICNDSINSGWNGPFSFTTYLSNPTLCGTEIFLKDENCNSGGETFFIDVKEEGILGSSIFLESIDFIMEHPWLADMEIIIENPAGSQAVLSQFNGAAQNNFGIVNLNCDTLTRFSSNACISIAEGNAPFAGVYSPITSLINLNDGTQAKGLWKIHFCDRSLDDKGVLRYILLNLTPQLCEPIVDFYISDIGGTSAMINWTPPFNCESLKMEYGKKGFQQGMGQGITKQVNCKKGKLLISGLDPTTEYDFYLLGDCITSLAAPSCKSSFTTSCGDQKYTTSFDNLNTCQNSCAIECKISDVWSNSFGTEIDWLIWSGPTDTKNTGPLYDVNRIGNYVYVESSPSICGVNKTAYLESDCIHLAKDTNCGMGFYYHMTGSNQGRLSLEISIDEGEQWTELFKVNSSEDWVLAQIPLDLYSGRSVYFRFIGTTGEGVEGDIAIDQIMFYGVTTFGEREYFLDKDKDGFGIKDSSIMLCGEIPEGYSIESGDCNDLNPNINPGMSEVGCNGTDENCNGLDDDNPAPPNYSIQELKNETCFGLKDGKLVINIDGDSNPYTVKWNTDSIGNSLTNIGAGFYRATITDASSCAIVTPFIEVKAESKMEIEVVRILNSTCTGRRDGEIVIKPTGGVKPYTYKWNINQIQATIIGLIEGDYRVTITDAEGCTKTHGPIHIGVDKPLNIGTAIHNNVSCNGYNDGKLVLNVTNGVLPYKYLWYNGNNTNTLENLPPGEYTATVTDKIGCEATYLGIVNEPKKLKQILLNIETIKCNGDRNGKIKTSTIGGVPPYTYQWSNGLKSDDIFDLPSGAYTLDVFDNNGCETSLDTIYLTEPSPLTLTVDSLKSATCRKSRDAAIYLSMEGGVKPYEYFWRRLEADTLSIDGILAGNYGFTGVDENECKVSLAGIDIQYGNQTSLITLETLKPYDCPNVNDGQLLATIEKATFPVNYNWNNGENRNSDKLVDTLKNLGPGSYKLTITDAEGCVSQSSLIQFEPIESFSHVVTTFIPNNCKYDSSGIIGIDVKGGSGSYTRKWSNGKSTPAIGKLPNGNYSLITNDANNCLYSINDIQMYSLSNIEIEAEIINTTGDLKNGSIKIIPSLGIPSYTVTWMPDTLSGFEIINLEKGFYRARIKDDLGCLIDTLFFVDLNTSSLDDNEGNYLMIFPNPAKDYLHIHSDLEIESIEIISIDGRHVKVHPYSSPDILINDLMSGLYILNIHLANGGLLREKLVIKQ